MPQKKDSGERDMTLEVDDTEYALDPAKSNAEGNESNRENHNKKKETSLV